MCYRDAPDDPGLSHQIHEGVLDSDQDVSGDPVAAALLDVGTWCVRVVASRRGRSGRHGAVAHRAGTRTGLWRQPESQPFQHPSMSQSQSRWFPGRTLYFLI